MIPEDLRYSSEHEWVRTQDGGDTTDGVTVARVGITDYAQNSLGDIVFVQMPEPGTTVEPGDAIGEVESTKSVSEIFAPLGGTVVARNDALDSAPELVNSDPYGAGWLFEVAVAEDGEKSELMDAAAYEQSVSG